MLHESVLKICHDKPLSTFLIPYWLLQGKSVVKRQLASRVDIDVCFLPYNQELLSWLKELRGQGRKLILCTASDYSFANAISEHLGIFDDVMASDDNMNLAGKHKALALTQRFGKSGFDYVGNSSADLVVWQQSRRAVVVNASEGLVKQAKNTCTVEKVFPSRPIGFTAWRRVLRVHQWMKNLLMFVPLLAAHHLTNLDAWQTIIVAFLSFSLCASCVYIVNDLSDLDSDRQHVRKCHRPFASGMVPVWMGVVLAPLLLITSLVLAQYVDGTFLPWLVFYFVLTCLYSWILKRIVLVDCLTLAMLYTLRIIAGAAAVAMALSFWLLAFSVFLFLSLAFVKRYAELQEHLLSDNLKVHGRGYYSSDAQVVQIMGITAGYIAVLVLALYLNSSAVFELYRTPELIWGSVPIMLFWVSWMWMLAHRGEMHDDPLVFAIKDKASILSGVSFILVLISGAIGWQWL